MKRRWNVLKLHEAKFLGANCWKPGTNSHVPTVYHTTGYQSVEEREGLQCGKRCRNGLS